MTEPRQCRGQVQWLISPADPDMTPPEGHVYVVIAVRREDVDPKLLFKHVRVVAEPAGEGGAS